MKVVICGSRMRGHTIGNLLDFSEDIRQRVSELPQTATVITGGAVGVDTWARMLAEKHGLTSWVFPADWELHGRRAGIIRNLQMLDEQPDLVIAYWDGVSPGTAHTIDEARRRGIPVELHTIGDSA